MVFFDSPMIGSFDPMSYRLWVRVALGYVIVVSVQIGLWALFAPGSFYDDFPGLGRAWVSVDGPYNEHLIRDVGALNLALCVLLVGAFIRLSPVLVLVAGIAVLVWGVPHAVYHLFSTDGLSATDNAISIGGLLLFALIGGGLVAVSTTGRLEHA